MEDDRLRLLVRVVPVLLLGAAGVWFYASSEMEGRARDFRAEVRQQPYARSGGLPSVEEVAARAQTLAQERGLELEEIAVTRNENGARDAQGNAAASALAGLQLNMRYTGYELTGRLRARKWVFSHREELRVAFSLRREVSTESIPGMRVPTPREMQGDEPAQGRGM